MTGESLATDRDCVRPGAGMGAIAVAGPTERHHG